MPARRQQWHAVGGAPHAHLAAQCTSRDERPIRTERNRIDGVERTRQDRPIEYRACQARVLRLHLLEVGLADKQIGEVQSLQVRSQQPEDIDRVSRAVALLRLWPIAPAFEQRQQPLLRTGTATFRLHSLEHRLADQTLLSLPHVVFGLGLDERLLHELLGPEAVMVRTL